MLAIRILALAVAITYNFCDGNIPGICKVALECGGKNGIPIATESVRSIQGLPGAMGPKGEPGISCTCPDVDDLYNQLDQLKKKVDVLSTDVTISTSSAMSIPTNNTDGWIVIQRRFSSNLDFNRKWDEYVNGFENPLGEMWLGLKHIHRLTNESEKILRIDLEDFYGYTRYQVYQNFKVGPPSDNYRLTVSRFYGTAGDSLTLENSGNQFSTRDKDHDTYGASCSTRYGYGGWWFGSCGNSNLNGVYAASDEDDGVFWHSWKGKTGLKATQMMIRNKSN